VTQPIIIDAHMHVHQKKEHGHAIKNTYEVWEYRQKEDVYYGSYAGDLEDVLDSLNTAGASMGIIVNLFYAEHYRNIEISKFPQDLTGSKRLQAIEAIDGRFGDLMKASNEWCCDVSEENQGLIAFIAIDPHVLSTEESIDHIHEMVNYKGAKGIKVHPAIQQFFMNDPKMITICETCVELDIPILSHSGPSRGEDQYAEPRAFAETMKQVPDLRLILAHLGGGAWSQTAEFARAFPTVYFDCSEIIEWTGAPDAPDDRELAQLILDIGPERVLMGSDFDWYDLAHTIERVYELPLLSKTEKEAILGENAVRFLGLELSN